MKKRKEITGNGGEVVACRWVRRATTSTSRREAAAGGGN
jgi:hypothetical protein